MAVAAIGERGERAVRERQQRRIGAFGRPRRVPGAGRGAHAFHAPAAEQPHDIDLMRRLIEHRAAALRGVEFFRAARAIEKVRVVERVDHAHGAERAARDQFARARDRRVERMAVADDEMHVRALRRLDHRGAVVERQRHRLLDQQMLAVLGGEHRMTRVILMRRRHIDGLDRRIGAQLLDRLVGLGGEIGGKTRPRLGARIGRRDQRNARIARERRQHHGEGAAEAGDAEPQFAFRVRSRFPRLDSLPDFH